MFFMLCVTSSWAQKSQEREKLERHVLPLHSLFSLLCSRGTPVFHTCSLCLIVFFSLCELVFHCIHLCIHRSHSLVLILLWAVCARLKLLSLGVCFSAHNVNLMDRLNIAFPFSTIVFAFCMDNNVGPCW